MVAGTDKPQKSNRAKRARIDEIMKHLFSVSKLTLVKMMNSLFNENFEPETVEIIQTNPEFEDFELEIIRGDMFLRFRDIAGKTEEKPNHFHIEFQTKRDRLIGIRVFGYAFNKAKENERLAHDGKTDDGEIVLYMPKSLVIHVEKHEKIPKDRYKIKIIFTDENNKETIINYTVPILRYWEYDEKRLIDEKLYPLLPLQLFMLRSELEKMSRRKNPQGKRETIAKIRVITEKIVHEAHRLGDIGEINDDDIEKITTAIGELFKHLNDKYRADAKLNEEVSDMIKTLYDERVFVRGKKERDMQLIEKMLRRGDTISEIADFLEITIEEVEKAKKKLQL